MSEISAAMVKQLRDATSAGMMDCKRALQETDGDFDAAVKLLREKGMASAAKRADRETTEGVVLTQADEEHGTIVAVGCETEPVSKNEDFVAFATDVLREVHERGEDAVELLEPQRAELSARLGENIRIVGARRIAAGSGEKLVSYVHPPAKKIGVLVDTRGGSPELPRELAMHIAFARPTYRTRDQVPVGPRRTRSATSSSSCRRSSRSRPTCARRSSRACSTSASTPSRCSRSRRGSTTRA